MVHHFELFPLLSMADLDESEGPVVTGISPSVGLPGTKVTIRGENLGESKDDVIGTIAIHSNYKCLFYK